MTLPIYHANTVSSNFLFDSVQTVCRSLYSLFSSCVNNEGAHTGSLWKTVNITKIDSSGIIRNDRNNKQRIAQFSCVVYEPTGELFNNDPLEAVRTKCMLVALASPVFAAVRLLGSSLRAFFDTGFFAGGMIYSFSEPSENTTEYRMRIFSDWTHRMKDNFLKIVTAPMLLVGMELGAITGLFMPLEGRRIVAMAESVYNNAVGAKNERCFLDSSANGQLQNNYESFLRSDICFLAKCFQPLGNMADKVGDSIKHTVVRESRLNSLPLPCL